MRLWHLPQFSCTFITNINMQALSVGISSRHSEPCWKNKPSESFKLTCNPTHARQTQHKLNCYHLRCPFMRSPPPVIAFNTVGCCFFSPFVLLFLWDSFAHDKLTARPENENGASPFVSLADGARSMPFENQPTANGFHNKQGKSLWSQSTFCYCHSQAIGSIIVGIAFSVCPPCVNDARVM